MQNCKSIVTDFFPQRMVYNVRFTFSVGDTTLAVLQLLNKTNKDDDTKYNI